MAGDNAHENGTAIAPDAAVEGSRSSNADPSDGHSGNRVRQRDKQSRRKRKFDGQDGYDGQGKQNDRADRRTAIKRQKADASGPSFMNIQFSAEEIAAEERRPKRKVAVLIGYAGTGYKGMQINHTEKTIEGDLFRAFVNAGAISKANASDVNKSSMMRCARTDKGVHAASNVVSLKLIVEDEDIVERINRHLPDQIRVWGIVRTNNAFSCYRACDSRWYEYLMPSYALLPPHPDSFLGKKVVEATKEKGEYDEWKAKFADIEHFWDMVDEEEIKPILEKLDPATRDEVLEKLHAVTKLENADDTAAKSEQGEGNQSASTPSSASAPAPPPIPTSTTAPVAEALAAPTGSDADTPTQMAEESKAAKNHKEKAYGYTPTPAEQAVRDIKTAYVAAKRRYRVTPERLQQLQAALDRYVGTHNFHNYTILKSFKDTSAKRHIKSFRVNPTPIQIRDTEWLSLKVHGQSFMMHQIRKMVAMAVLCVRCGAPLDRIEQSYQAKRISIPKAPGLGLLLERPVFENYSQRATDNLGKEPIDFDKYEKEIDEFKREQIYKRMWDVEETENVFHTFFHQLDNFNTDFFLWVTAHGFDAAYERKERGEPVPKGLEEELGDDGEDPEEGEG